MATFPTINPTPADGDEVSFSADANSVVRKIKYSAARNAWDYVNTSAAATVLTCSVSTTTPSPGLLFTGETATVQFTFSEPVTGFDVSSVVVTNGTLSNFAGSGASYTATFTPSSTCRNEYTAVIKVPANVCVAAVDSTRKNLESTAGTINLFLQLMASPGLNGNASYILNTAARTLSLTITPSSNSVWTGLATSDIAVDFNGTGVATGGGTVASLTSTASNSRSFTYTPPANTTGYVDLYVKAGAFTGSSGACDASPRLRLNLLTAGITPVLSAYSGFGSIASYIGATKATLKMTLPVPRANVRTAVNDWTTSDITVTPSTAGTVSNVQPFPGDSNSYLFDFTPAPNQASQTVSFSVAANTAQYELPTSSGTYYSNAASAALVCTISSTTLNFLTSSPESAATNVQVTSAALTFSKTIDTVDNSKVFLRIGATFEDGVDAAFTTSLSGAVLSITAIGGFLLNTQYWIYLAAGAVTDQYANKSVSEVSPYTFTTAATSVGHLIYTTPGAYSLQVPTGVTSIAAVTIGSGQQGRYEGTGGRGADLAYKNNIAVTPGETLQVAVGSFGTMSSLKRGATTLVSANGGNSTPGFVGDGGGYGSVGDSSQVFRCRGGNTGLYTGNAPAATATPTDQPGVGSGLYGPGTGPYGAGGAGGDGCTSGSDGGQGAVRVLWGAGRAFPSTNVSSQYA